MVFIIKGVEVSINRCHYRWFATVGCICLVLMLPVCRSNASEIDIDRYLKIAELARADGEHESSHRILSQLVRLAPGHEGVNFAFGLVCLEMGNASSAEMAFQRVLLINPDNHRARLELARAFSASESYDQARHELQRVLASRPPPRVRENVQAYLSSLPGGMGAGQRAYGLQLEIGIFHDSNVNAGPNDDIIRIFPISFGPVVFDSLQVGEASKPKSDAGVSLSARGRWVRGVGSAGWLMECGVHGAVNRLMDEHDFELAHGQLHVAMMRRDGPRMLYLPVRYAHVYRGGESLMQSVGLGGVYSHMFLANRHRVTVRTDAQWRDYADGTHRDGLYAFSGVAYDRFVGEKRHSVGTGITYLQDFADEAIFKKKGARVHVNGSLNLPWRCTLHGSASYMTEYYKERDPLAPDIREDQQVQFAGGVRKQAGAKTAIDLRHNYTQNRSNFDLYDYRRHVSTLSMTYAF